MNFSLICKHDSHTAGDKEDLELQKRVILFLKAWSTIEGSVSVEVVHGIVKMHGRVASPHDRWLLWGCCSHVAGVLRVEDNLVVDPNWSGEEVLLSKEA